MHGVGLPFARNAFESFGFKPFEEVDEQVRNLLENYYNFIQKNNIYII